VLTPGLFLAGIAVVDHLQSDFSKAFVPSVKEISSSGKLKIIKINSIIKTDVEQFQCHFNCFPSLTSAGYYFDLNS
jgi:hypothetical protein